MGRDARLKRALAADNRGNRARILVARGTCNALLCGDMRIQEHYRDWVRAQEFHRRNRPAWVRTHADIDRCVAVIRNAEITFIANVLRTIGVPWRWCADALVRFYFPLMRHNEQHPDDYRVAKLTIPAPKGLLLQGQAPPHDAWEIRRDVEWWYRHRVKSPSDSIHALAEEYAKSEQRVTDSRSVVQTGIVRAETLLENRYPVGRSDEEGTK